MACRSTSRSDGSRSPGCAPMHGARREPQEPLVDIRRGPPYAESMDVQDRLVTLLARLCDNTAAGKVIWCAESLSRHDSRLRYDGDGGSVILKGSGYRYTGSNV